jgi:hypothetical protein
MATNLTRNEYSNYRIVIDLLETNWFGQPKSHDQIVTDGRGLVQEIKRHVDYTKSAHVDYDIAKVCRFCGYGWELYEGLPQCCDAAQRAWRLAELDDVGSPCP